MFNHAFTTRNMLMEFKIFRFGCTLTLKLRFAYRYDSIVNLIFPKLIITIERHLKLYVINLVSAIVIMSDICLN